MFYNTTLSVSSPSSQNILNSCSFEGLFYLRPTHRCPVFCCIRYSCWVSMLIKLRFMVVYLLMIIYHMHRRVNYKQNIHYRLKSVFVLAYLFTRGWTRYNCRQRHIPSTMSLRYTEVIFLFSTIYKASTKGWLQYIDISSNCCYFYRI